MEEYKLRLESELVETKLRLDKLRAFLQTEAVNKLQPFQKKMLETQADNMEDYYNTLEARVKFEFIDRDPLTDQTFDFGVALSMIQDGNAVARKGWTDKNLFIFKQIPASVTGEGITRMISLPDNVKNIMVDRRNARFISYVNQIILINKGTGVATYYTPNGEDMFALDWFKL